VIALKEAECCARAGTDSRPTPLRRQGSRPQLKRDPLGSAHPMALYAIRPNSLHGARPLVGSARAASWTLGLLVASVASCGQIRQIQQTSVDINSGTIRGQLVDDASGQPIDRARVDLLADTGATAQERFTWTYERGAFSLSSVRPGAYRIRATIEGYEPQVSERLQVGAGDLVTITLRLRRARD
jgi:Carboxypeptidase regulatory-like domain